MEHEPQTTPTGRATAGKPAAGTAAADADALTATILAAVERQLTRYFAAMSKQTDEVRQTAERFHRQVEDQLPALQAMIERQRANNDAYQNALQAALEERLSEFANHQHWRMNDLEDRVAALPTNPGLSQDDLLEVRHAVRDDLERAFTGVNERLDDLVHAQNRLDEQTSATIQHVNESTAALAKRMDEGDERITLAVEERLCGAEQTFASAITEVEQQVGDHTRQLLDKLESNDSKVTDRLLALEARINEEQGTRIANLEAAMGRTAAGFDEAMVAVNQRVLELENRIFGLVDTLDALTEQVTKFDEKALEELKSQMSSAVGEAMLVRIELDRAVTSMEDKLDKQALKVAEVEAKLEDQEDVGTAVQLERIDELERAMAMLDPRKINALLDASHSGLLTGAGTTLGGLPGPTGPAVGPTTGSVPRVPMPAMTLNPKLPGSDTSTHDSGASDVGMQDVAPYDTTTEHEATYSPY